MQERDLDRVCQLTDEVFAKIDEIKAIYPNLGEELGKMFVQRMRDRFENDL